MVTQRILVITFTCILLGCSKGKEEVQDKEKNPAYAARSSEQTIQALEAFREIVKSARTAPPAERLSMTQFFANINLSAYENVGRKNPKWDNEAKHLLSLLSTNFAVLTIEAAGKGTDEEISREMQPLPHLMKAADAAEKAGCEDPLVRYFILRQRHDPYKGGSEVTNLWVQVANDLEQLDYHPYWKFFSRWSAAVSVRAEARKTKSKSNVQPMGNLCNELSIGMLQDHSLPIEAIYSIVHEIYITEIRKPGLPQYAIGAVQPLLIAGWGDTAAAWYCIGRFHISYAWEKRGSGYAKDVTEEGWQAMAENLGIARIAFEKSWDIKPMEDTAVKMLTVEIGNTQGREAMEKWFQRAMQQNPASYSAAMAKFQWLTKSWHGNDDLVIAFGRECVTNTAYRGRVPLVNREVHRALSEIYRMNGKGEEEDYWREPGVWPDVKATFDRFFEVNPENVSWRYDYALLAYHARAWHDFLAQVKRIDPIDYEYFGGKESLQDMIAEAEKNR